MIRKDFYLRMIAELGEALRRALELRKNQRTEAARKVLDETVEAFFDMQTIAARNLPEAELYARMARETPEKSEYYRQLADLLLLDGDLLWDENQHAEAGAAWQQALRILSWMQANIDTVFSFDRIARLQELRQRMQRLQVEADANE